MASLPALSEADVRLRLYPSTGRVVKVTEGYWPSRLLHGIRGGAVVYALPEPLPPSPAMVAVQSHMRATARRHFRNKALGYQCDCTVCHPAPRERFTNAVCSACGKGSTGNIDARGACAACGAPFQITPLPAPGALGDVFMDAGGCAFYEHDGERWIPARTRPEGEPDDNH